MVLDTVSGAIPSCASIAVRGVEKFLFEIESLESQR